MYDGLYELFRDRDIEIVVHADHPTLNREVADLVARGERIDVLATHSKYAPSQRRWLRSLDGCIATDGLAPKAVELCAFEGVQYCVPRNIDVRVLWANANLVDVLNAASIPRTWDALAASRSSFGFPGRESGLFGTLFEIVSAFGGSLFDEELWPTMHSEEVMLALACLARLGKQAPLDQPTWHYDDVDRALIDGRVAFAAAWPGATSMLRESPIGEYLLPFPYLAGPSGIRSYAGCHAWAIPTTVGDVDGAIALVNELCGYEAQATDAQNGSVCAHVEAFDDAAVTDEIDARRRAILAATIADGMLTYPPMERFPEIEDAGWSAIHALLLGESTVEQAARAMQHAAERVVQ